MTGRRQGKAPLTPREFQAAECIWRGMSGNAAAAALGIKRESLNQYIFHALHKVGVRNRGELRGWFGEKFPTAHRRRKGYMEACVYFVEGWLSRNEITHAKRSAESFLRRPEASTRRRANAGSNTPENTLTTAQFKSCQLLTEGKTSRQIGAQLGVGQETVKKHLYNAAIKAGTENRVELALWFTAKYPNTAALQAGLVAAARCERDARRNRVRHRILATLGK